MSTDNEFDKDTTSSRFAGSYLTGKTSVLKTPRWKFYFWGVAGILIGNLVRSWLVSKYSISQSETFFFATIAVILTGLVGGLALLLGAVREARRGSSYE